MNNATTPVGSSTIDQSCPIKRQHCLVNVDLQNDFITGALALKDAPAGHDGTEIIPTINRLTQYGSFNMIVYSLDFHPPNHISFMDNAQLYRSTPAELKNDKDQKKEMWVTIPPYGIIHQRLWPRHCVERTAGACLHPNLYIKPTSVFVHKGNKTLIESYSVFGNDKMNYSTGLHNLLKSAGITDLYFTGLAEDICVGYSALDALRLGYNVTVITDATRGTNIEDCVVMRKRIEQLGGHYESSSNVLLRLQQCQ